MPSIISAGFAVDHGIGLRVLGFTALLSLLTALLFGLAPALQASRPDLVPALKEEVGLAGRSPRRPLGELLVVAQLALSLAVLIATGLFVRSLQRAQTIDVGFVTKSLIVAQLNFGRRRHPEGQVREFYRRLKERVESLPGVRFAGLTDVVPLGNKSRDADIVVEGSESATVAVGTSFVDPKYFQTMGIPVLRGRNFSEQDGEASPSTAVIISEAMAQRFWPGESPLGKRLWLGRVRLEVIGVVRDSKYGYLAEAPRPYMYRPGAPGAAMKLVVRTAGDPEPTIGVLRREIESAGGGLVQAAQVKTMTEHLDPLLGPMRSGAEALAVFSLLAIVLTAVGIYGVMAYAVVRRTREIGIRMALGADAGDVLKLVARGMTLAMIGVAFGLAAAFPVARLLVSFLYGVSATDPKAFIGASLLCMLVALLASYIPARKATKLDPIAALRHE
jgi:predicted permease